MGGRSPVGHCHFHTVTMATTAAAAAAARWLPWQRQKSMNFYLRLLIHLVNMQITVTHLHIDDWPPWQYANEMQMSDRMIPSASSAASISLIETNWNVIQIKPIRVN